MAISPRCTDPRAFFIHVSFVAVLGVTNGRTPLGVPGGVKVGCPAMTVGLETARERQKAIAGLQPLEPRRASCCSAALSVKAACGVGRAEREGLGMR